MEKATISEIEKITRNINDIITNKVFNLPFFNKNNYNINIKTFKRTLITDYENYINKLPPAFYNSKDNTIYIGQIVFHPALLLHEMIHMLSSDIDKKICGYADNMEHYYFNEAATQYLTRKFFGNQNNSNGYDEITDIFELMVKKYGENVMFNGFFEASFNKFIEQFNEVERKKVNIAITQINDTMKEKEEIIKTTNRNNCL